MLVILGLLPIQGCMQQTHHCEKILKLFGKNKMRLNEEFEPIVKYPYAVLQCNGLLDEQDKVFSEENYSPRRRKLSEKKEEKENASTESITRESVFPYFVGFSFSIQLITFLLFCMLLRHSQESFGIIKALSTEITRLEIIAFFESSSAFGVWSF